MAKRKLDAGERLTDEEALEGILDERVELSESAVANFTDTGREILLIVGHHESEEPLLLTLTETWNLFEWLRLHESELWVLVSE
jgi:hypothetical protein